MTRRDLAVALALYALARAIIALREPAMAPRIYDAPVPPPPLDEVALDALPRWPAPGVRPGAGLAPRLLRLMQLHAERCPLPGRTHAMSLCELERLERAILTEIYG